jgi:hypothetical protein
MLKLCGFPVSNYYNKVKLALLEKGVPFEEVLVYPSSEAAVSRHSPMGKVPFILDGELVLSESQAIIEYLEDVYPETPLYPRDAARAAKVRELIEVMELYLELAARPCTPRHSSAERSPKTSNAKLLCNSAKGLLRSPGSCGSDRSLRGPSSAMPIARPWRICLSSPRQAGLCSGLRYSMKSRGLETIWGTSAPAPRHRQSKPTAGPDSSSSWPEASAKRMPIEDCLTALRNAYLQCPTRRLSDASRVCASALQQRRLRLLQLCM